MKNDMVIQSMSPKYKQMLEILMKNIFTMKRDEKLPSFRELMNEYNVSYTTVSRVLVELQGKGLIYKIQGKGIFTTGKHLDKDKPDNFNFKNSISLILPFSPGHDVLIGNVLNAAEEVCEENGFLLHISVIDRTVDEKIVYLNRLVDSGLKGMIVFLKDSIFKNSNYLKMIEQFFQKLNKKNYPYVFIDRYIEGIDADYVVVDHKFGIQLSTNHLINQGAEFLYFVYNAGTENISSVKDKVYGFNKTIEKNKKKCKGKIISNRTLFNNIVAIVKDNEKKVGFVCNDDALAARIVDELANEKYFAGIDYYIMGYGNFRDLTAFDTIEQYPDKMGKMASEILMSKIMRRKISREKIKIKPILIRRVKK